MIAYDLFCLSESLLHNNVLASLGAKAGQRGAEHWDSFVGVSGLLYRRTSFLPDEGMILLLHW